MNGLTGLRYFKASNNKLTALPDDFGNCKSLNSLNLANNLISTLPIEIKGWTNLSELNLGNNKIKNLGAIPLLKTKIQANEYGNGFVITNNPISEIPKTYNDWLRKRKYGQSQAIFNLIN